jgi:predicted ATPase
MSAQDRITEIRIRGLRTIADLSLPLDGLTVLVGENGTGKSSILEACEILRRAAGPSFFDELHAIHGGALQLLRHGAAALDLGVTIHAERMESGMRVGYDLIYQITLERPSSSFTIGTETLRFSDAPPDHFLLRRSRDTAVVDHPHGTTHVETLRDDELALVHPQIVSRQDWVATVAAALAAIDVHVPFEVVPRWIARAHDRRSATRSTVVVQPTRRLERLGANLANAYDAIRVDFDEERWHTTMDLVRLGLGDHVESIKLRPDPGGGAIALWLKLRNRDEQIPAAALSDGELAYLAFVALYRLDPRRALLAFDEPDLHLHPGLLARVVDFFESLAETQPVLIATQSDRLLDCLRDPARSVRVCDADPETRATRVRRLDPDALENWLTRYRGLGELRSAGYLRQVLKDEDPT